MKKSWLIAIFAAVMLSGCMVAAGAPMEPDYEDCYYDYDFFPDDDVLFDFLAGYHGNEHVHEHGYVLEEIID